MTDELLTASEMAKRVRVQAGTLREWSRRGLIPSVRISRKTVRFDPIAVLSALMDSYGNSKKLDQPVNNRLRGRRPGATR